MSVCLSDLFCLLVFVVNAIVWNNYAMRLFVCGLTL